MTLDDLLADLSRADAATPLVFATPEGPIGDGFHVTEFKQAQVRSIDCGGVEDAWSETRMQLMAGPGAPLSVDQFRRIAHRSSGAVDGLSGSPLLIEYAPSNAGLRQYAIRDVQQTDNALRVEIIEDQVACKAMGRIAQTRKAETATCCT